MILFTTFFGALSELLIVGLTPGQTLVTRLGAIPANLVTSRPYGIYRDVLMRRSGVHVVPGPQGRMLRFLVDTLAFVSFKMPLYAILLKLVGATWTEVWVAIGSAIVLALSLGRLYGLFLDRMRRVFGVPALETPPD